MRQSSGAKRGAVDQSSPRWWTKVTGGTSPTSATKHWSLKATRMRSSCRRGRTYRVLLVSGRISVSQNIFPQSAGALPHPFTTQTTSFSWWIGGLTAVETFFTGVSKWSGCQPPAGPLICHSHVYAAVGSAVDAPRFVRQETGKPARRRFAISNRGLAHSYFVAWPVSSFRLTTGTVSAPCRSRLEDVLFSEPCLAYRTFEMGAHTGVPVISECLQPVPARGSALAAFPGFRRRSNTSANRRRPRRPRRAGGGHHPAMSHACCTGW